MKKALLLPLLAALVLFLTCKKDSSGPVSITPPPSEGTPEPTPVGTAIGPPTSTTIGPSGGTASSSDGQLSVSIPAGVLNTDTTITVQAITNNALGGFGTAYRLGPDGMHFSTPVTLRFSYPGDSVQVPELLGIAYQDTDHIWYSVPDYSVDSLTRTVSASINHFSDWSDFERVWISPTNISISVNQVMNLQLSELPDEGEASQPHPIYRITDDQVAWSASAGTISRVASDPLFNSAAALFRAPSAVPAGNPVRVTAAVNRRFTYHGTIVPTNRTTFLSYITITNGTYRFHVEIYYDDPHYQAGPDSVLWHLTDTCGVDLLVNQTLVSADNETNHDSHITPASQTSPSGCAMTWIPTGPGIMNLMSVYGTVDTMGYVLLTLLHRAYQEEFQWSCPGEPTYTGGGGPAAGEPPDLAFPTFFQGNSYFNYRGLDPTVSFRVTRQ